MDINQMTRKQFEELPYVDEFKDIDVDSIVLLPSRKHHDSGFNYYNVILCNKWEAIGKCPRYDTFSIMMESNFNKVGIDCLRGSGLIRIFLPQNEYVAKSLFHKIERKKAKCDVDKLVEFVENTNGKDLKPMWDNWKEKYRNKEIGNEENNS